MNFETQVRQLAQGSSLKIYKVDYRHAELLFTISGRDQALWVLPFGDVWEFSVQSALKFDNEEAFPQWLLATVLTQNSKNKRAFWCIETLNNKYVLSAMLNFPSSVLSPSEFYNICWALVREVDVLEQAFVSVLSGFQRTK